MRLKCAQCGKMFKASPSQEKRSRWPSTQPVFGFCCSGQCISRIGVKSRCVVKHLSVEELARSRLNNAVAAGKLVRPRRCSRCGASPKKDRLGRSRIHAHHPNHFKELAVVWLCDSCHREISPQARGERSGNAKFTNEKVKLIRKLYLVESLSGPFLASKFGVTKKAIYDVIHRRTWGHV